MTGATDSRLTTLTRDVHVLRGNLHEWQDRIRLSREKWDNENADLLRNSRFIQEVLDSTENELRKGALAIYEKTNNKAPGPGLGIRETTVLRYTPEKALAWALEHHMALALDKKAFEAIAKAQPLEFGEVHKEAVATIAQDLEPHLAKITEGGDV